jgi:cellulose synthase (UDP-forming)
MALKEIANYFVTFVRDLLGRQSYQRFREREDRRRRLLTQFFTILTMVIGIYYLIWHYFYINWSIWFISIPFFGAEVISLVLFLGTSLTSWYPRFHDPQGIVSDKTFSVDVFITTCGEPLEIVQKTMQAAVAIGYGPKTLYLLDDKANPELAALAGSLGFQYLARPKHDNAKAGNLNYGLAHSFGDLILALDADQVPSPEILQRLVGYFRIPKIAFVQSKQNFLVPHGDPFGNTDKIFYNVMQSGKDSDNAAFSCGSGVVYRREALAEIDGFSTWNLVEDVHTSMLLHQRGWKSVYYNYPLTIGTAPTDIWSVYRQRAQWATDSLRLNFWDSPFFRRGLTLKQKMQYFNLGFVYLVSAFVMPIFFVVPVWTIFSGSFVLTASVDNYILHRLPAFVCMSVAYGSLNYPTPYLQAYQMWTGLFPVFIKATFQALRYRRRKPPYRVTSKEHRKKLRRPAILAIIPQLLLIVANLVAIIYGFFILRNSADFLLLNVAWAIWAIWTMSGICVASFSKITFMESQPEPENFTAAEVVNNVLGLILFICIVSFGAVLLLRMH